jgi:hypothetical protein
MSFGYDFTDGIQILLPHKAGVVYEAGPAWKLFRCRADENKSARYNRFLKALELLSTGEYSIREVAEETGYAKNTIWRLLKKLRARRQLMGLGDIYCPCGTALVTLKKEKSL